MPTRVGYKGNIIQPLGPAHLEPSSQHKNFLLPTLGIPTRVDSYEVLKQLVRSLKWSPLYLPRVSWATPKARVLPAMMSTTKHVPAILAHTSAAEIFPHVLAARGSKSVRTAWKGPCPTNCTYVIDISSQPLRGLYPARMSLKLYSRPDLFKPQRAGPHAHFIRQNYSTGRGRCLKQFLQTPTKISQRVESGRRGCGARTHPSAGRRDRC